MAMLSNCIKCGGALIKDYEDMKCILCGYMKYNISAEIKKDVEEAKGKMYMERKHKAPNYYHKKEADLFGAER